MGVVVFIIYFPLNLKGHMETEPKRKPSSYLLFLVYKASGLTIKTCRLLDDFIICQNNVFDNKGPNFLISMENIIEELTTPYMQCDTPGAKQYHLVTKGFHTAIYLPDLLFLL